MKRVFYYLLVPVLLFSCKKDEEPVEAPDYSHGIYISNEGNFQSSNASITHISNSGVITGDVYLKENSVELGDVLQCFEIMGNNGYAVLNNSDRVAVIDVATMKHKTDIEGLENPRYIHNTGSGKAYITNGSVTGEVKVVDTGSNTVTATIPVGYGPEKMAQHGDYVFVCNYAFGGDNRVSVIDVNSDTVVEEIVVADGPSDAVTDAAGNLWVLCSGNTLYDGSWNVVGHTAAMIYRINAETFDVEDSLQVGDIGDHPRNIAISPGEETIYYENHGVYAFSASAFTLPGSKIIEEERASLDVNPATGELWCAGVSDYVSPSIVYKYSSEGVLMSTYTAGIASNGVRFR
jgi:YVTN family beta-propeller protein